MIKTCDVGSMPFHGNFKRFLKGVQSIDPLMELLHVDKNVKERKYFEEKVVQNFIDKMRIGIDIPSYPQFRDMNEMFFNITQGIKKSKRGYEVVDKLTVKKRHISIPEVHVIRQKMRKISQIIDKPVKVKLCVTGPYTLSSSCVNKNADVIKWFGEVIVQIIEENCFKGKHGGILLVSIDEPVFGMVDDPQLDVGSSSREMLIKTWETIFHKIKVKKIQSCLHLHNTTNETFWGIKSLDIVESHVNDSLYTSEETKLLLEKEDKYLKASISITLFDDLIRKKIEATMRQINESEVNQKIADIWTEIQKGRLATTGYIETPELMKKRLLQIINRYGMDRVPYAGPECGLKSFPTYSSAIECLRRVVKATQQMNMLKEFREKIL
jgi:5-methyltetrahydropteroyltriglutamate--homocysteine methyltransferase